MTRAEFIQQAMEAARAASAESGLPAGITVAQAALESRWGESELSRRGNNYFGIKAHGKHAWVEMPTTEVVKGVAQKVSARFAAYRDMRECFACRDALILRGAVYVEARRKKDDPEAFARELAKHWATDPEYAEKLMRVYRENGLDRVEEVPVLSRPSGTPTGSAQ
jgi:flagellum-specific peptidoglycan hydrolase FlgJ